VVYFPEIMDATRIEKNKTRRPKLWMIFLLVNAIILLIVFIPVFVIMPFKAQSASGVEWSYWLRRFSPVVTILLTLTALLFAYNLWRGARWWSRIALSILLIFTFAATWMAQQNHFEWMFNPLPNPAYVKVSEAKFVADTDMVMAVEINGEAVAYPVRQMAYHHVVQDVVGGKPITATY
jgi:hypothetical protein